VTRSDLSRLARRFVLMLGGEVTQSLFHLALNLVLVRHLSAHEYGVFAIVFLVGGIALTFVRAVAGVPASIFMPQARHPRAVGAYGVTFGSGALALSLLLGTGTGAVLAVAIGPGTAVAGGAFVGLWSLRSYLRNMLFARRLAAVSGVGDLAFTLSGAALLALLIAHGEEAEILPGSLAILALAHGIGIAVALAALREPVRIDLRRHALRRYRSLWRSLAWSVAGVATANIQAQGQTLLVALLAGPAAYAPIAAVFVLFSPLRLSGSVVVNLTQPEMAAALAAGDARRLRQLMAMATGLLAIGCLAYGGILAAALPLIESHVFAGRFAGEPIGLITAVIWTIVMTTMLYVAPKTLLETRRAFRELAFAALVSAVIGLALVALLLRYASPAWSLLGLVASEVAILVYCWRKILDSAAATPEARPLRAPRSPDSPPARSSGLCEGRSR
jgi:O-antigen/teichoic acid export membrane protein